MRMLFLLCILAFLFVWANKTPDQTFSEALAEITKTVTKGFEEDTTPKTAKLKNQDKKTPNQELTRVNPVNPPPLRNTNFKPPKSKPEYRKAPSPKPETKKPSKPASHTGKDFQITRKPAMERVPAPPRPQKATGGGHVERRTPPPLPEPKNVKKQPKPIIQSTVQTDKGRKTPKVRAKPMQPDPVVIKKLKAKEKAAINSALKRLQSIDVGD